MTTGTDRQNDNQPASQHASLAEPVHELQQKLVRSVNDTHIFVQQALRLLSQAKERYEKSDDPDDKPYTAPSLKKGKVAKRNDEELREIYDRYIATDLYNNLLVAMVSQCESFLFDVLRLVLRAYPKKLTITNQGAEIKKSIDISLVLDAVDIEFVRNAIIEQRLHSVSYAKPADYLQLLNTIAQISTDDDAFAAYIEIKATRDIIAHNAGIANATYKEKVGDKARADDGHPLPMNTAYFDQCVVTIKRVAGIVDHDIKKHFNA
jgi:hypothetical protein